ncbi:MAG: hypothetical protein NTV49_13915 [Kiritimatiellaeota bacterium]|nr:hypothetical protein [Kiritimatiellota bacterium]
MLWVLAVLAGHVAQADLILEMPPYSFSEKTAATMDAARQGLTTKYHGVARYLDSFFKREDAPPDIPKSTARVRLSLRLKDADGLSPSTAFNAKLALPHAEERLHIFADNLKRGTLPGTEDPILADDRVNAGVRFWLWRQLRTYVNFESGIRLRGIPDPFGQLEFQHQRPWARWIGRFTQQGFGYAKEGLGELSQVDLERHFGTSHLFRATTAATWTEETVGVEFEQTFIYAQPLRGAHRSLLPSVSFFAHKNGPFLMDNYRANVTYRTGFFRPWLLLEITPQIEFPRERDYQFTPSLRIGFEAWFGSLPGD